MKDVKIGRRDQVTSGGGKRKDAEKESAALTDTRSS